MTVEKGKVVLRRKPEVQKAGGVYYTPTFVVDHIVRATLAPLLKGLTPNKVAELRVVDPACGSGSFLLGVYQYLLDWHLDYYLAQKRPSRRVVTRGADGRWRLTLSERKRILISNVYGVDIDPQAVEVAKLSLLLKVVEGETQLGLAVDRLLPSLHKNIQCGNSLVGSDFYDPTELVTLTPDELAEVNAFDWALAFPEAKEARGFDAVVGNPPWLMAGYYLADAKPYLQRQYSTWVGKADLYYLFLEKACRLVRPGGRVGMIVPSKLFHTKAANTLRQLLADGNWVESIVDFGLTRVFEGATNYSAILQLRRDSKGDIELVEADYNFTNLRNRAVDRRDLGGGPWHLIPRDRDALWKRLRSESEPLQKITARFGTGAQTGADKILIFKDDDPAVAELERDYLAPILKGRAVRRWSASPFHLAVFPYVTDPKTDEFVLQDEATLKSKAPRLWQYMNDDRDRLDSRVWFGKSAAELSGAWYGWPYLDSRWAFAAPHLVTPSLADRSNFALGDGDLFVTGTAGVTSVIPEDDIGESLHYLLALLNSELLSRYITDHSTPYQGGYFKFSAPYLRDVPIRRINFEDEEDVAAHNELALLATGLSERLAGMDEVSVADSEAVSRSLQAAEQRINEIVLKLYGVSEDEAAVLR